MSNYTRTQNFGELPASSASMNLALAADVISVQTGHLDRLAILPQRLGGGGIQCVPECSMTNSAVQFQSV